MFTGDFELPTRSLPNGPLRWTFSLAALAMALVPGAPRALAQPTPIESNLVIAPESGPAGTPFRVSGRANPTEIVDIQWTTWDGGYSTETTSETVAYHQRVFAEKRVSLGTVTADAQGEFSASVSVPEDFGQLHEIHAVVDGKDVGRSGFQVLMAGTATPASGPVGTPIHIRITGLNTNLFSGSTLALRYDNAYTGVLTATTTGGTAEATIRASGPLGEHSIVVGAGTTPAYLNIHQSPYDFLYAHLPEGEGFQFKFTTTSDEGAAEPTSEWPALESVRELAADAPRTTFEALSSPTNATMLLEPTSGPILTRTHVSASGLQPNTDTLLVWMTARGNRVSGSGWDLASLSLGQARTDARGNLSMDAEIPDDLGGWHMLKLVQDTTTVAQAPFYVERSLASVSNSRPRIGETFTIQAKGLGWTELDNGFAVTYDNKFIGYACGFNSNGDVSMPLIATGEPGTHLIDLYPMVYNGQDRKDWYWAPVLTFSRDFPALGLGYRIPAFRLAINVVE
jgi:hypothetical protein